MYILVIFLLAGSAMSHHFKPLTMIYTCDIYIEVFRSMFFQCIGSKPWRTKTCESATHTHTHTHIIYNCDTCGPTETLQYDLISYCTYLFVTRISQYTKGCHSPERRLRCMLQTQCNLVFCFNIISHPQVNQSSAIRKLQLPIAIYVADSIQEQI